MIVNPKKAAPRKTIRITTFRKSADIGGHFDRFSRSEDLGLEPLMQLKRQISHLDESRTGAATIGVPLGFAKAIPVDSVRVSAWIVALQKRVQAHIAEAAQREGPDAQRIVCTAAELICATLQAFRTARSSISESFAVLPHDIWREHRGFIRDAEGLLGRPLAGLGTTTNAGEALAKMERQTWEVFLGQTLLEIASACLAPSSRFWAYPNPVKIGRYDFVYAQNELLRSYSVTPEEQIYFQAFFHRSILRAHDLMQLRADLLSRADTAFETKEGAEVDRTRSEYRKLWAELIVRYTEMFYRLARQRPGTILHSLNRLERENLVRLPYKNQHVDQHTTLDWPNLLEHILVAPQHEDFGKGLTPDQEALVRAMIAVRNDMGLDARTRYSINRAILRYAGFDYLARFSSLGLQLPESAVPIFETIDGWKKTIEEYHKSIGDEPPIPSLRRMDADNFLHGILRNRLVPEAQTNLAKREIDILFGLGS